VVLFCHIFVKAGFLIDWFWRSHSDYQQFAVGRLSTIAQSNPCALLEYQAEISKLYILDLDPLKRIIIPYTLTSADPQDINPIMVMH